MTAPAGTGTVKDRSLLQSVQLRRVKALVVPLHKELLDLLHRGQAGHGAHTGHGDGGGVAGKSQGLALGQTGGEAGAEGGHKGVAGGRGVGHMLHLHAVGVMDALFETVDLFCESVGFSLAQSERVFQAAQALGIPIKGHVEQLSLLGGAQLVSRYHGLSADHIEYLDEAGVAAMSQSGTVGVLLPGAFYFLKEQQRPPVALLRQYQVPMVVATDFNPGTSPFISLHWAMNMACVQFGLTPEEAWAGVTRHAARALGRHATHGQLKAGFVADFVVWDATLPVEILYEPGRNPLYQRVFKGQIA